MAGRRKRSAIDTSDDEGETTSTTNSRSGSEDSEARPQAKRSKQETVLDKFNAKHDTANKTNEEILGALAFIH